MSGRFYLLQGTERRQGKASGSNESLCPHFVHIDEEVISDDHNFFFFFSFFDCSRGRRATGRKAAAQASSHTMDGVSRKADYAHFLSLII